MKTLQIKIAVALAALVLLALPTVAFGASSDEGYGGPNNVVSGVTDDDAGGDEEDSSPEGETAGVSGEEDSGDDDSDVLPFTGADLLIMAISGGLLLMFGFGLRRLTRRPSL